MIEAIRTEKPDIVGLSGLLVKSAQQMVITAQDFKAAGIDVPILVGGAAFTRRFTETKIAAEYDGPVLYAKDAMFGLELANRLQDPEEREVLSSNLMNNGKTCRKRCLAMKNAASPVAEVKEQRPSKQY